MTEWGVMHISTMRFQALNRRFFVLFTGQFFLLRGKLLIFRFQLVDVQTF